jgi:calpain
MAFCVRVKSEELENFVNVTPEQVEAKDANRTFKLEANTELDGNENTPEVIPEVVQEGNTGSSSGGLLSRNFLGINCLSCLFCGTEPQTEGEGTEDPRENDPKEKEPKEEIDIIVDDRKNPWTKTGKLYNQDFKELKSAALSSKKLFKDPEFTTNNRSLYYSKRPPHSYEWKRASDISGDPKFFEEGATRFDINQGELGDCWLLAAIAGVAMDKSLFYRVVDKEQNFVKEDYAGIFHFRFWQYGEWIDVVIDDYLPTRGGSLVFLHSKAKNEFWPALLEKAYAKLYGSYEALEGGMVGEALDDLTGGCTEYYDLKGKDAPEDLFGLMEKTTKQHSLESCSIIANPKVTEQRMSSGLVRGHAYSITKVFEADINTSNISGKVPFIRIRNPWGAVEWNGAWSDKSDEWKALPEEDKSKIGLDIKEDGEFWMNFQDFRKHWETLEICNLLTDVENEATRNNRLGWFVKSAKGSWVPGESAGGCRNFIDTFASNPQYRFRLEQPDEGDTNNLCTVIISLMQKDRRKLREEGLDSLPIGFQLYSLFPDPDTLPNPLNQDFFRRRMSLGGTKTFIPLRENTGRLSIPPGTYCIVPSTFNAGQAADFFLRLFTHRELSGDF